MGAPVIAQDSVVAIAACGGNIVFDIGTEPLGCGSELRGQYGILDDSGEHGMGVSSDLWTLVLEPRTFRKPL